MAKNLSDQFVDYLYNLKDTEFPNRVILQAKRCLIDYLGVTFAGAKMIKEKGEKLLDFNGKGETSAIGFDHKTSIENAVLINGISSHIAELDDGSRYGAIHPGSPILSVLLPVAKREKIEVNELISGIIIGYEAAIRIATAVQPSHYNNGYHPTATCGSIGAAMGIATMLGFSKAQMKDTLSAAVVSSSGTLKVIEEGSEIKPFNCGRAAVIALLASNMARAGFKGPDEVLEGKTGFLSMMSSQYDVSQLINKNDDSLCIEKIYVKPYAACRHAHPSIEAVLFLKSKFDINIDDIESIKVSTYRGVLGKHDHKSALSVSSAKMSIPFAIAVSLISGKAGIMEFTDEYVADEQIKKLISKINIVADPEISKLVPQQRSAIVEINTFSSNIFNKRVDFPKGEPENPLSKEEIELKFQNLAEFSNKSSEFIQEIIDIVWKLENNINKLFERI